MHGFNTFEVDTFRYPNVCSKCAKHEPGDTWEVVHSTIEFPDGPPTGAVGERRNYNDYVARVPICNACRTALKKSVRLCWLVGAVAGAVAAFYLMDYLASADLKPQGRILLALLAAVTTTIGLGWVLRVVGMEGFGFAKLDGLNARLTFTNKEYQKLFDEQNPTAWKPGAPPATGALLSAKGW